VKIVSRFCWVCTSASSSIYFTRGKLRL